MRIEIDRYRTEPGEWTVGASLYRNKRAMAPHQWVLNLELGRNVRTVYVSGGPR